MTDATIFPATDYHVELLLAALREEDRAELLKEYKDPRDAFARSMYRAEAFSAFSPRGRIMVIGGCNKRIVLGDVACPWLLTTKEVEVYPKIFLKRTRYFVERWRKEHKILRNYVDASYEKALRWAAWAGFEVGEPQPHGFTGDLFCKIEIRS